MTVVFFDARSAESDNLTVFAWAIADYRPNVLKTEWFSAGTRLATILLNAEASNTETNGAPAPGWNRRIGESFAAEWGHR